MYQRGLRLDEYREVNKAISDMNTIEFINLLKTNYHNALTSSYV